MSDKKATEKLAKAMNNLADTLQRFQDPVLWQRTLTDAFQSPGFRALLPGLSVGAPGAQPQIESVTVILSDKDRAKMADQVYKAVKPQVAEFSKFLKESLKEMPPHRLKELAAKIEAGHTPKIERRRGCVFLTCDGLEAYLGL